MTNGCNEPNDEKRESNFCVGEWMKLDEELLDNLQVQINLISGACEDLMKAIRCLGARVEVLEYATGSVSTEDPR